MTFSLHFRIPDDESSNRLFSIYDYQTGEILIPSFKVRPLPRDYEFLARVPDQVILQNFSTSPGISTLPGVGEMASTAELNSYQ